MMYDRRCLFNNGKPHTFMLWKFKAQDTFWGVTSSDMVSRLPPLSGSSPTPTRSIQQHVSYPRDRAFRVAVSSSSSKLVVVYKF